MREEAGPGFLSGPVMAVQWSGIWTKFSACHLSAAPAISLEVEAVSPWLTSPLGCIKYPRSFH